MENVTGVLIMTVPEMLGVLLLIILSHVILIIKKKKFLVLGEGPRDGINDGTGAPEKQN